jgi:hypothetical protein
VPGYHASSTAGVFAIHGIATGPPVSSTTTVRAFAPATLSISLSWLSGSASDVASFASPIHCVANTSATSACAATRAARAGSVPSSYTTFAFGASAWIWRSGDDGWYTTGPGQLFGSRPFTAIPPTGYT